MRRAPYTFFLLRVINHVVSSDSLIASNSKQTDKIRFIFVRLSKNRGNTHELQFVRKVGHVARNVLNEKRVASNLWTRSELLRISEREASRFDRSNDLLRISGFMGHYWNPRHMRTWEERAWIETNLVLEGLRLCLLLSFYTVAWFVRKFEYSLYLFFVLNLSTSIDRYFMSFVLFIILMDKTNSIVEHKQYLKFSSVVTCMLQSGLFASKISF